VAEQRVQRRLAAILAADVVGYSALMQRAEEATYAEFERLKREVIEPSLSRHEGRLIKTTGDGALAEFASPLAAVGCAVEIQYGLASGSHGFKLRIGINLGDVIVGTGGDLFGDGINIAVRLEGTADPGGILISEKVYSEVEGKLDVGFEDRGEQQLKNITKPVRAYVVRAGEHSEISAAPPLPDKPSIAVLPFQNMSGDSEQEYFTDGMVEDIITALSRFKSLFVIARNSSFTYKGKAVDIKQVGRELGVRYVLEGSVRKAGGKIRITGQLIDATTGAHLWADRFDGPLNDIFDLQDKVTSSVVGVIAPRLELAEIERSERKPTENLDAIDLYYRAIQSYWRVTRPGNEDALRLARQAISLDPKFAAAYGLALACYAQRGDEGWLKDDDVAEGKQYALRAVEVGADDAFALSRAGFFFAYQLKDTGTADVILDRAIAVNPNLSVAWRLRGFIDVYLGRHEPALEQFHYAIRLNPLDPEIHKVEYGLALANFFLRRFEIALSWITKSLARQKNFAPAQRFALVSYAMLGRIADAQMMQARLVEAGIDLTISQLKKRIPYQRQEDVDLFIEALRMAGVPE